MSHCTYRVQWSPEDNEYVALVAEFPSLSWLDEDPVCALAGLVELVDGVLKDMRKTGGDLTASGRKRSPVGPVPDPSSMTRTSRRRLERYAIKGKQNVQGNRGPRPKTQRDCQTPE
ncbi:toxin-antitoxin system HicB family antitoxin [Mycobacteroides abscessus]|nr:toxin-antitoxin system HicB family antitoxin [Mycobacteroides abscessus]